MVVRQAYLITEEECIKLGSYRGKESQFLIEKSDENKKLQRFLGSPDKIFAILLEGINRPTLQIYKVVDADGENVEVYVDTPRTKDYLFSNFYSIKCVKSCYGDDVVYELKKAHLQCPDELVKELCGVYFGVNVNLREES